MSDLDLPLAVRMMQDGYLMEIQDLKEKNEKLRVLVRDMAAVICVYDQCVTVDDCPPALPMFADKMRELGIEVKE